MHVAFAILTALIAATPLIAIFDGLLIRGPVELLVACLVAITALSLPSGEGRHLAKLIAPAAICLALPAIWMIIQALPLPFEGLFHPIWASAAAALGEHLRGFISVDPGATLVALASYAATVGVIVAAAALSIDRRRAERALFWLTGVTAVAGIMLVTTNIVDHSLMGMEIGDQVKAVLATLTALGVPISAAAVGHLFERFERRRTRAEMSLPHFGAMFSGCVAALAICLGALAYSAALPMRLAALGGLAIVAGVVIIRRLGLGFWTSAALGATAFIIVVAFVTTRSSGHGDFTLRYAEASARSVTIAENMKSDTAWTGSGAGTYGALAPIYKDLDSTAHEFMPPTAAAEIAIELGTAALWIILGFVIASTGSLLRGALTRGRDCFYAAAGAGSTVVLVLRAFADASGFATPVVIIAAAAFGLGLAQSVSRSIQQP